MSEYQKLFLILVPFLSVQAGLLVLLEYSGPRRVVRPVEEIPVLSDPSESPVPVEITETSELEPIALLTSDPSGSRALPLLGPVLAIDAVGVVIFLGWQRTRDLLVANRVAGLERSNQDLSEFAHTVSHDLQEPLRAIRGAIERALREKSVSNGVIGSRTERALRTAAVAADDLACRVHEVLERARADSIPIHPIRTDVAEVLDRVERCLSEAIHERRVTLCRGAMPVITVDPVILELLFQNLIGNALRYGCGEVTKTGNGWSEISVRAFHVKENRTAYHPDGGMDHPEKISVEPSETGESSGWFFAVEDHGPGISPEDQERIFEPFRQGRHATRSELTGEPTGSVELTVSGDPTKATEPPKTTKCVGVTGYGAGLAACRRMVERHGGAIRLIPTSGGGTTVLFSLDIPELPVSIDHVQEYTGGKDEKFMFRERVGGREGGGSPRDDRRNRSYTDSSGGGLRADVRSSPGRSSDVRRSGASGHGLWSEDDVYGGADTHGASDASDRQ
ncbi:MAG: HAMP domain-containing sensor histidine kinase [Planctomycetia bacterium]|nr:HAMP domain-containing sensor histidine kinase [Planctomycetia bacterium]